MAMPYKGARRKTTVRLPEKIAQKVDACGVPLNDLVVELLSEKFAEELAKDEDNVTEEVPQNAA